jgi:pyrrolidone-carboxylate peptidase
MILIYAFSNSWGTNISRLALNELQKNLDNSQIRFLPIVGYPHQFFQKYIQNSHYDLIIGLGDGSKFISKIKIETRAKNVYLDKEIYPFSSIFLDLNLPVIDNFDSEFFQIGSNMGTYNCNYLAYQTQLYLNQKSPQTKHLFLHLPQKSKASFLTEKITQLLIDNKIL